MVSFSARELWEWIKQIHSSITSWKDWFIFIIKIYQWLCWEEEKKSVSCTPDDGHSSRLQLQDQRLKSIKPPPLNHNSFNSWPSSLLLFVTAANFNGTILTLPVMSEWSRRHRRPFVWVTNHFHRWMKSKLWMPHLEEGSLHTSESVCCCIWELLCAVAHSALCPSSWALQLITLPWLHQCLFVML